MVHFVGGRARGTGSYYTARCGAAAGGGLHHLCRQSCKPGAAGAGKGGLRHLQQRGNDAGAGCSCDEGERGGAQGYRSPPHRGPLPVRRDTRADGSLLDAWGIAYDDTPGVSSFCGAAAALNASTRCPASARPSSLHGWRTAPLCRGRTLGCAGGPRCHNGDLSLNRADRQGTGPRCCRVPTPLRPRQRSCIRLPGRRKKNSTLYCWHAGRADESGRHYQDGAHRGGGFPRCAV